MLNIFLMFSHAVWSNNAQEVSLPDQGFQMWPLSIDPSDKLEISVSLLFCCCCRQEFLARVLVIFLGLEIQSLPLTKKLLVIFKIFLKIIQQLLGCDGSPQPDQHEWHFWCNIWFGLKWKKTLEGLNTAMASKSSLSPLRRDFLLI